MNSGGHGLGLSICKLIAERLNGKISVQSAENSGTTMTLSFRPLGTGAVVEMSRRERRNVERNRSEVERLTTIQEADNESEISISRQVRTNNQRPVINKIIVAEDQLVNL